MEWEVIGKFLMLFVILIPIIYFAFKAGRGAAEVAQKKKKPTEVFGARREWLKVLATFAIFGIATVSVLIDFNLTGYAFLFMIFGIIFVWVILPRVKKSRGIK